MKGRPIRDGDVESVGVGHLFFAASLDEGPSHQGRRQWQTSTAATFSADEPR